MRGQTPQPAVHRLEATPATVAYGYYWSAAEPVLKIPSGDIIDVDTLLTNTPAGLARAGVPDNKIQDSLKAIQLIPVKDRPKNGAYENQPSAEAQDQRFPRKTARKFGPRGVGVQDPEVRASQSIPVSQVQQFLLLP